MELQATPTSWPDHFETATGIPSLLRDNNYTCQELVSGDLQSITSWIETTKAEGKSIDILDEANGLNALHYAIIFKQTEVVEALLESGASADYHGRLRFAPGNEFKLSPLQLAILSPTPFNEAEKLLVKYTKDMNEVIAGSYMVCRSA